MRPALLAAAALWLAACNGDDGDGDGTTDAAIDSGGPDAAACVLPSTLITCTEGDDSPCTAMCAQAYCHLFSRVGTICTQPCAVAGDCPQGWSCNMMGRCRPPD